MGAPVKVPVIRGLIKRRLLINFRVDPAVMKRQLPPRFAPKLQDGHAVAGICLIRLEDIRPRRLPAALGVSSENAAHRVAVTWTDDAGRPAEGVFIPRRDTGSALNALAGGRLFPGEHHRSRFEVKDEGGRIDLEMRSRDGAVTVRVKARAAKALPPVSCFRSLEQASGFFQGGALGYSVTGEPGRLDGIELRTDRWNIEPLEVEEAYSSWFLDESRFPKGSVVFDCGLVMRDTGHEWHATEDLYA